MTILSDLPGQAAEPGPQDVVRVDATPAALDLIAKLERRHGPLLFHQSGGCCDGSAPMCFPRGDFMTGDSDVKLGEIGGQPFFMGKLQFEYWKHTRLTIDVVKGRGGMFSLEGPEGVRFLTRSDLFTDEEVAVLEAREGRGVLGTWAESRVSPYRCSHILRKKR